MIHHLLVPPNFKWKPANQTVMEGTKTAFHCNASGNPTPKISWMKDGNALAEGNSLSLETNRNNSGNYWCLAKNGVENIVLKREKIALKTFSVSQLSMYRKFCPPTVDH